MSSNKYLPLRLGVLAAALFIELMIISLNFDAFLPSISQGTTWFGFIAYAGQFAKFAITVITALTLAVWTRLPQHYETLQTQLKVYKYHYYFTLQLLTFSLFYWNTSIIFGTNLAPQDISNLFIISWFVLFTAVSVLWLFSIAPWMYWKTFVKTEKVPILLSLLLGLLAWGLAQLSQQLWGPLSSLTFHASAFFLDIFYSGIVVDPVNKQLGTQHFIVNIAPACSGYEGIGLVTIFTGFYLSIFKKEFKFPQALLLFPIGILTIWIFNALRIAVLIIIGDSISEDVALGGFHSQAGWISFIIVIFGLLTIAHKASFFCTQPIPTSTSDTSISLPMALLAPFIVLLASTILTSALSAQFNWFYPIRVLATAIALKYCWRYYQLSQFKINIEPIIIGIIVFVVWIFLIPNDHEQNALFAKSLSESSPALGITWLIFRFVGAVITVPIVEELLFRGYLLCKLAKTDIILEKHIPLSWTALVVSSILFGLLHSSLIAGTFAGLAYGLVRYRSSSIFDVILAHGVTNLLISLLVLSTGYWSLW